MVSQDDWNYTGGYGISEEAKTANKCWNRIVAFAEKQGYKIIRYRSPNKGQYYIDNHDTRYKDWPHYFYDYGWKIEKANSDLGDRYWIVEER